MQHSFDFVRPIENIQPIVSHKMQPTHLACIELGLHLQVPEIFVVCVYHNLFADQVAALLAACLYDGQCFMVMHWVLLLY